MTYCDNVKTIRTLKELIKEGDIEKSVLENNVDKIYDLYNTLKFNKKPSYTFNLVTCIMSGFDSINNNLKNLMKDFECYQCTDSNVIFTYYCDKDTQLQKTANEKANILLNVAIVMKHHFMSATTTSSPIVIHWAAIDKRRTSAYELTRDNIDKSKRDFEAFTASGYTTGHTTYITRYEEIVKLLIHELIHNFNLDHHNVPSTIAIRDKYKSTKHKNTYEYDYDLYESYTELLSTYFNIIHFIQMNNPPLSKNDATDKIRAYILCEMLYSFNVVANIIRKQNINSVEEFVRKGKQFCDFGICVYEYYYLKSMMFNTIKIPDDLRDSTKVEPIYEQIASCDFLNDNPLFNKVFNNYIDTTNYSFTFLGNVVILEPNNVDLNSDENIVIVNDSYPEMIVPYDEYNYFNDRYIVEEPNTYFVDDGMYYNPYSYYGLY